MLDDADEDDFLSIDTPETDTAVVEREFAENMKSRRWRISNLYWVKDKYGHVVKFTPYSYQLQLLDDLHTLNIILKARQMGFSTFIQILALDCMVFNSNFAVGIVADTLANAKKFLKRIVYSYSKLPEAIREHRALTTDNAEDIEFSNGSRCSVGVSLRSDTYNFVHISEYGKICAKFPDKAKEIKSGALNTIAPGQLVFIESTAEGRGGDFHDKVEYSRKIIEAGREPSGVEYRFHFFPWYADTTYQTDDEVRMTPDDLKYFRELRDNHGISLTKKQRHWYVAKHRAEQGEDMTKEYPSTPDEAFMAARDGAYWAKPLANLRALGFIDSFPFEARTVVNTFWDLGINDMTTIWLHQQIAGRHRFVGYYENSGEGMDFYLDWLDKWRSRRNAVWGAHYAPHDVEHRRMGRKAQSIKDICTELGFDFNVVDRTQNKLNSIHAVRTILPSCEFDETECATGLLHLENYSREWDEKYSVWKKEPRHDEHSHGADGFITFADGYQVPDTTNYEFKRLSVA